MIFQAQKQFITDLPDQIFRVLKQTIEDNDFFIIDAVTDKQLFDLGEDGKGNRLPGYTRTTIRIKLSKNQPADRTTLKDSGKFHASFRVDAFNDRFEVKATDENNLIERYGIDILRITNDNLRDFLNMYFINNLKSYVSSKFTK